MVLLPPIGLVAAYLYCRNVNIRAAIFIAIGFLLAALRRARGAGESVHFSNVMLARMFGVFMLVADELIDLAALVVETGGVCNCTTWRIGHAACDEVFHEGERLYS